MQRAEVLHALFESQADARPDAIAVEFGDQAITYAALDRRANQIARRLRTEGIGRGARVALILPRSIDAYATILAILKVGAAYVPIDPEWPLARAHWVLADSGAGALVTTGDRARALGGFQGAVLRLDVEHGLLARADDGRLDDGESAGSRDLAYVIYTSGSTGHPKGVM